MTASLLGFSMQELADNCGLTVTGLLPHVGSEEALLVSLLQARDQRHLPKAAQVPALTFVRISR